MKFSIIQINWKIVPLAIIRMSLAYVYGATKYNKWVMSHPFDPHLFVLFERYTICDIQALFSPMSNVVGDSRYPPWTYSYMVACESFLSWTLSLEVVSITQFQRHIPLVISRPKKHDSSQ